MKDKQAACREILRLIQGVADPPIAGRAEEALRALITELVAPEVTAISESLAIWAYAAGGAGIGMLAEVMLGYDFTEPKRRYALSEAKLETCEAIVELIIDVIEVEDEPLAEFVDLILRVDAHVSSEAERAEL